MARGAFTVSQDSKDLRDIKFSTREDLDGEVPADQAELLASVTKALLVLKVIFPQNDEKFKEYFRQLLSLAQLGLAAENAQPKLATGALDGLKSEITARESTLYKGRYLRRFAAVAFVIGFSVLILGCLSYLENWAVVFHFAFLLFWCQWGAWLSRALRHSAISFDDLHILDEGHLDPWIRLFVTLLLTLIFALFLSTDIVEIKIGSLSLSKFTESVEVAALLGLVCGFSEKALSAQVSAKAAEIVNTIGNK